jgi:hypothetical protein
LPSLRTRRPSRASTPMEGSHFCPGHSLWLLAARCGTGQGRAPSPGLPGLEWRVLCPHSMAVTPPGWMSIGSCEARDGQAPSPIGGVRPKTALPWLRTVLLVAQLLWILQGSGRGSTFRPAPLRSRYLRGPEQASEHLDWVCHVAAPSVCECLGMFPQPARVGQHPDLCSAVWPGPDHRAQQGSHDMPRLLESWPCQLLVRF